MSENADFITVETYAQQEKTIIYYFLYFSRHGPYVYPHIAFPIHCVLE